MLKCYPTDDSTDGIGRVAEEGMFRLFNGPSKNHLARSWPSTCGRCDPLFDQRLACLRGRPPGRRGNITTQKHTYCLPRRRWLHATRRKLEESRQPRTTGMRSVPQEAMVITDVGLLLDCQVGEDMLVAKFWRYVNCCQCSAIWAVQSYLTAACSLATE